MRKISIREGIRCDKIQQAEQTEIVQNLDGELYAVLFNANDGSHSNDIRRVYYSLMDAGASDSNILVLEGDGSTRNRFVDGPATIKSLDEAFDLIRQTAKPNDRLLSYVTNHGNIAYGQSYFNAHDGTIWEGDFEKITSNLPVNLGLFYFAQCNSGGFAERMGYGRNIGMSSASREENSHGGLAINRATKEEIKSRSVGNYFSQFLFPEIMGKGKTIESAFDEAVFEDTSDERLNGIGRKEGFMYNDGSLGLETPQLRWQNADPSKLCLFPYKLDFMNEKR